MARTLTTIGIDGTDPFKRVVDGINFEIKDRNLIGNLDGIDMSFMVCLSDAVAKLGGTWDVRNKEDYYVALDGAPLESILP